MLLVPTIDEVSRVRMSRLLVALNAFYVICGFLLCRTSLKLQSIIIDFNKLFHVSYDNYLVSILIFCGLTLIAGSLACMYFFLGAMIPSQRIKTMHKYFYLRLYMVLQSIIILVCVSLMPRERNNLKISIEHGITESMKQYKINLEKKKLIDLLQMKYYCCGSDKYSDWFQIAWNSGEFMMDLEKKLKSGRYTEDDVPFSCCNPDSSRPCINRKVHDNNAHPSYDFAVDLTLHKIGCKEAIERYMDSRCFWPLIASTSFFLIIYQLNLIFASFLDTSIRIANSFGDVKSSTPAFCCECCFKSPSTSTSGDFASAFSSDSVNPFYVPSYECLNQSNAGYDQNASNSYISDINRGATFETSASVNSVLWDSKIQMIGNNSLKGFVQSDIVQPSKLRQNIATSSLHSRLFIFPEVKIVRSLPKLFKYY